MIEAGRFAAAAVISAVATSQADRLDAVSNDPPPTTRNTIRRRGSGTSTSTSADLAKQVTFTEDVPTLFDRLYPGDQSRESRSKGAISASGFLSWHPPPGQPHTPESGST